MTSSEALQQNDLDFGLEALYPILNQDGFIGFIEGRKGKGKTDIGLLLAEICYLKGFRKIIATNIGTDSYMVQSQITNVPDLKEWLLQPGRKLFILDEAGKHLGRLTFMSKKNRAVMEAVQLIRHFDCGLIAITLAARFIDSGYVDPEVIDFVIKKISLGYAKCRLENDMLKFYGVPKTSINFNSKDIAEFTLEKKRILTDLQLCCQVAQLYSEGVTYTQIGTQLNLHVEKAKRLLREHLKHSDFTIHNH